MLRCEQERGDRDWQRLGPWRRGSQRKRRAHRGAMRMRVPVAQQERFTEYWRQCETEALAIEAYAQHYMQDSFSSGHMWERWGATESSRSKAIR